MEIQIKAHELLAGISLVKVDNTEFMPDLKGIILQVTSITPTQDIDENKTWTYGIGLQHINKKPNTFYNTYSQFLRFIKPVRLTEKILLDADFKPYAAKDNGWFTKNYVAEMQDALMQMSLNVLTGSCSIENISDDDWTPAYITYPIEFMHQLQKIWLDFTSKELPYNFENGKENS